MRALLLAIALTLAPLATAAAQPARLAVQVSADNPARGPADALVTLVTFGDYRCPFCKRLQVTLDELRDKFPEDVRVVHKTFNLPHFKSRDASVMACVAHRARRWDKLDKLLWEIDRSATVDKKLVTQLGREVGVKRRHVRRHWRACEKQIDVEQAEGAGLGVTGIPATFVNGIALGGARPLADLEELVEREIALAREDIEAGRATRATYYDERIVARAAARPAAPRPKRRPDPQSVYAIPIAGDPAVGKRDALVTAVIAWELFEPFSRRLYEQTLPALLARGDVRIVFKHHLASNARASHRAAHLAACAAGRQGRYLPYVEALWARVAGGTFSRALLREIASDVGLSLALFDANMRSQQCGKQIERDAALWARLGAEGTPVTFINGRYIQGAQSPAVFDKLIEIERIKAQKRVRQGARPASYYRQFVVTVGKRSP